MKNTLKITVIIIFTFLLFGCGPSKIARFAEESYKIEPTIRIEDKLAMFSVMIAESDSLNKIAAGQVKTLESPYVYSKVNDSTPPNKNLLEGFSLHTDEIFLAKLKAYRTDLNIIPPKHVQSIINQSDIATDYLKLLTNYNYLSANPEFLKKLGNHLSCKYLIIPQLAVISNSYSNSIYLAWAFGRKSTNYSVTILAQIWDMSTGNLVWSGRSTSSTIVESYKKLPYFDQLASEACEELIRILP